MGLAWIVDVHLIQHATYLRGYLLLSRDGEWNHLGTYVLKDSNKNYVNSVRLLFIDCIIWSGTLFHLNTMLWETRHCYWNWSHCHVQKVWIFFIQNYNKICTNIILQMTPFLMTYLIKAVFYSGLFEIST